MSTDVAPVPRGLAAVGLGAVLGAVGIAWIVVFTGVANGTTVPVADTAQILTVSTATVLLAWRRRSIRRVDPPGPSWPEPPPCGPSPTWCGCCRPPGPGTRSPTV